ncbi:MAG TPA: hypothetical protein VEF34_13055 [Syntrophobacteraceae bacterium]|nr:hypothetical protein [Syntrophobacteraceae bacterium]
MTKLGTITSTGSLKLTVYAGLRRNDAKGLLLEARLNGIRIACKSRLMHACFQDRSFDKDPRAGI